MLNYVASYFAGTDPEDANASFSVDSRSSSPNTGRPGDDHTDVDATSVVSRLSVVTSSSAIGGGSKRGSRRDSRIGTPGMGRTQTANTSFYSCVEEESTAPDLYSMYSCDSEFAMDASHGGPPSIVDRSPSGTTTDRDVLTLERSDSHDDVDDSDDHEGLDSTARFDGNKTKSVSKPRDASPTPDGSSGSSNGKPHPIIADQESSVHNSSVALETASFSKSLPDGHPLTMGPLGNSGGGAIDAEKKVEGGGDSKKVSKPPLMTISAPSEDDLVELDAEVQELFAEEMAKLNSSRRSNSGAGSGGVKKGGDGVGNNLAEEETGSEERIGDVLQALEARMASVLRSLDRNETVLQETPLTDDNRGGKSSFAKSKSVDDAIARRVKAKQRRLDLDNDVFGKMSGQNSNSSNKTAGWSPLPKPLTDSVEVGEEEENDEIYSDDDEITRYKKMQKRRPVRDLGPVASAGRNHHHHQHNTTGPRDQHLSATGFATSSAGGSNQSSFEVEDHEPPVTPPHRRRRKVFTLRDQWMEIGKEVLIPFFLLPPLILTLVLLVYEKAPAPICNDSCECNTSESANFTFTYGIILHFPRCFIFSLLTEVLVQAQELHNSNPRRTRYRGIRWDIEPLASLIKKKRVWSLTFFAFLFFLIVESQSFHLPPEARVPVSLVATVLAFAIFCFWYDAARSALPIGILVVTPLCYQILVPSSVSDEGKAWGRKMFWPVIVVGIDRVLFYLLHTALPEHVGVGIKVIVAHLAVFFSQQMILSMAFATSFEENVTVTVVYFLLVVACEFLLNSLAIEWLYSAVRTKVAKCRDDPSWESKPIEATDFRSIATQTRHMTLLLAMLTVIPGLAVGTYPRKIAITNCNGVLQLDVPYMQYLYLWLFVGLAIGLVSLVRCSGGVVRLPLYIRDGWWCIAVGLHFCMLAPEALAFLPLSK